MWHDCSATASPLRDHHRLTTWLRDIETIERREAFRKHEMREKEISAILAYGDAPRLLIHIECNLEEETICSPRSSPVQTCNAVRRAQSVENDPRLTWP